MLIGSIEQRNRRQYKKADKFPNSHIHVCNIRRIPSSRCFLRCLHILHVPIWPIYVRQVFSCGRHVQPQLCTGDLFVSSQKACTVHLKISGGAFRHKLSRCRSECPLSSPLIAQDRHKLGAVYVEFMLLFVALSAVLSTICLLCIAKLKWVVRRHRTAAFSLTGNLYYSRRCQFPVNRNSDWSFDEESYDILFKIGIFIQRAPR